MTNIDQANFLNTQEDNSAETISKQHSHEQNIWNNIGIWCLYLLTFLAPLFFLPFTINPVGLNKQVLIIILVLIALISFIAKAFIAGEITYHKSIINLAIVSLIIVTGISAIFSISRYDSLGHLYALQDSFLNIVLYGLSFWLYAHMLKDSQVIFRVMLLFILSLFLVSVLSLLQINQIFLFPWNFANNPKATAFHTLGSHDFSTHMPVAIMMAVGIIILTVFCATVRLTPLIRLLSALLGLTMFANLFLINSSIVWTGLALSMIIILSYQLFKGNIKKINDIILPIFILMLSIILFIIESSELIKKDLQKELVLGSANVTWDITKQTLSGYKNFFLGSGPATFRYDNSQYRDIVFNRGDMWGARFNNGYSSFLTYLTTVGILGILTWFFLIGSCLFVFTKSLSALAKREESYKDWLKEECFLLSASVSVLFLFFVWFFYPLNLTITLFLFVLAGVASAVSSVHLAHSHPGKHANVLHIFIAANDNRKTSISFMLVIFLVLVLSFSLTGIYIVIQKYAGAVYAAKGINEFNASQAAEPAINYLNKAINLDKRQDKYYRTLAEIQNIQANNLFKEINKLNTEGVLDQKKRDDMLQKLEAHFKSAVVNAQQAVQINPVDSAHWLFLGAILENRAGLFADMDDLANQAYAQYITLEPKNPDGHLSLGRLNMVIANRYSELMASPQIAKQKDGDKIIANLKKLNADHLTKALANMQEAIKLKPNYALARYLVAQIYEKQGKLNEAIKELAISAAIYNKDPKVSFQLGVMYYKNKEYENAKNELLRTLSLADDYNDAHFYLGFIYDKLGDKESAKKEFESVAKSNTNNSGVKAVIDQVLKNIKENKPATTGLNVE